MVSKWTQPTPVGTVLDTSARIQIRGARAATTNRTRTLARSRAARGYIAIGYNSNDYYRRATCTCAYVAVHACRCAPTLGSSRLRPLARVSYVRGVDDAAVVVVDVIVILRRTYTRISSPGCLWTCAELGLGSARGTRPRADNHR